MTEQGSARTVFRRALRSHDPLLVWRAAFDLSNITSEEAFAVLLVLAGARDRHYDRAACRLVSRVARRANMTLASTAELCRLLVAAGTFEAPVEPLRAAALVLERSGVRGARREFDEWHGG